MRVKPRIDFRGHDHAIEVRIFHGRDCVGLTIDGSLGHAAVVLTSDEAEQLGRNLVRQARFSREPAP